MMTSLLAQSQTWTPAAEEFFRFSPELAWVGTLCLIMIAPLIIGRHAKTIATLALIGIAVTGFFTLRVASLVAGAGESGLSPLPADGLPGGMLIADNLTVFFKLVLLVFLVGVIALWWVCSAEEGKDAPEFFVLLLGSALGMALMVSTQNLLMIVVAIEFASLPSYAIVGFNKKNRLAAEASLKYMIFGAICAAVMLYGASLLYGCFGSLNAAVIAERAVDALAIPGAHRLMVGVGLFCFFVGIGFKVSAVPFHFWCPDAFQGAKIEVTAWLSVASKAAGLLLLLRLVHTFAAHAGGEMLIAPAWVIGIVASLTCTVGNFAAYGQRSVKRMLAYSSIAHAGYMLMAAAIFVVPARSASFPAISAVLVYVVVYMFMNLGAFGVVALLGLRNGGDDDIGAFTGLMRRAPVLAVPMLFCLVSLVGLPPFAGFVAKYYLLSALGEADRALFWALIVVAVVNTLISLWYYMRVVIQMMLRDNDEPAFDVPAGGAILVNICGIMLIVLLVFSSPLKRRADRYAANLFAPEAASANGADSVVAAVP